MTTRILASARGTILNRLTLVPLATLILQAACSTAHSSARATSSERSQAGIATLVIAADSFASARRYQEASDRYAAALRLWPDSLGIAKRALGAFWRAARYDDAYVWGRRVLAREPRSLDVLFNLGVTCGFLIELQCVDESFHRGLALDSSFVDGHGELAFLAQAKGNLSEAIRHMEAAYALAPDNDFAVSGLAQMLIPARQAERARSVMRPRLRANRKARAYGGRSMLTLDAWALLQLGDTASANVEFNEVLGSLREREQAGQTTYQLYRERAAIYALRGERVAAISAMQTAYDRGWRLYGSWSLPDPMFANVMGESAVVLLVERMRADVRAMRRRLGMDTAN